MHPNKINHDPWQRGTKERSDVFLVGGSFLLTFRTFCPLSPAAGLALPPTCLPRRHWPVGGLFLKGVWSLRTSITQGPTYLPKCMREPGRYSAAGLQQLTVEHFAQCLQEQRRSETAIRNRFLVVFFFSRPFPSDVQRGLEMRHALAAPENVENNSLSMTSLFKICSHCERLSKKVRKRHPKACGNKRLFEVWSVKMRSY